MEKKYCFIFTALEGKWFKQWKNHFITVYGHKMESAKKDAIRMIEQHYRKYEIREIFVEYKKRIRGE